MNGSKSGPNNLQIILYREKDISTSIDHSSVQSYLVLAFGRYVRYTNTISGAANRPYLNIVSHTDCKDLVAKNGGRYQ